MTRAIALLLLLPLLAACASPRERCIADAGRELAVLDRLIAETRATLSRGYALREEDRPVSYYTWCAGESGKAVWCRQVDIRTERVPVAVDMAAERRKLADLEARRTAEAARAAAAIRRCEAAYHEG
jgi:hypothetical protein